MAKISQNFCGLCDEQDVSLGICCMFLVLAVLEIVFPSNREWAVSGRLRGRTPVHP